MLWTMTLWRDDTSIIAYVKAGAHGASMRYLSRWSREAAVVRWPQRDLDLPSWPVAARRLHEAGRALPLRNPGPAHADLSFVDRPVGFTTRL